MSTITEDLTAQINGVTDTFSTTNDISGGVVIDVNGQIINQNDITILTPNTFQLSFVPLTGDTIAAFISPDKFIVTSQIDGIKTIFDKDPLDTNQGSFIAILNGQVKQQETVTINQDSFSLPFTPQIGDELEYFRAIGVFDLSKSLIVDGEVNLFQVKGSIRKENKTSGIINLKSLVGRITKNYGISGDLHTFLELNGEIKK